MSKISIYIHIPFCSSKCYYCSFVSSVQNDETKGKYFKALTNEILTCDWEDCGRVSTIYFGGGTPSCVDPKFIEQILQTIRKKFAVDRDAEITIECNPNSLNEEKLVYYKKIGINRLSIGIQSFNKKSLKFVGRVGDEELKEYKKKALNALKTARNVGFENISVDFILGLPYQRDSHIKGFIRKLSKYVAHFSCYMLMVEKNTKLAELLPNGISDDIVANQYEKAVRVLKKLGFERYEISNFSKKGRESKHNKVYWSRGAYLGFGVAAHSFYGNKRIANTESLEDYIKFYTGTSNKFDVKTVENIGSKELAEESIMLSLRTREGLDLSKFEKDFYDLKTKKASKLASLLEMGFVKLENNFIRLSDKGFLLANEIITQLID